MYKLSSAKWSDLRSKFIIGLIWIGSFSVSPVKGQLESVKEGQFENGAVVCAQPLAAGVGAEILKEGGNAFDAAIATQFVLAVVYPQAGNIGGGGFMIARRADGNLLALDFREKAPLAATSDMYLDKNGMAVMSKSQDGHLSVGVPGAIAGIFAMYSNAVLPFERLIDPAIKLAEKGFKVTESEANLLNRFKADFEKYNTGKVAFVKASAWKAGDLLVQKDLAGTLRRIKAKGQSGFYSGKTAALIQKEMNRGKGIITLADLHQYKAVERKPVSFLYRGYQIVSFPPPSSGGLLLAQMLGMISPYNMKELGFLSAAAIHVMTEAERRAYADRAAYMGDPDFWKVPDSALMDPGYLQKRMADFNPEQATPSSAVASGQLYESKETTHLCVADKSGNLVSITTTLNGNFGSRVVVAGAGFLLNDEMDDFSVKPGVPNMYGAVGGQANAIAPGKRMLSSMCPTLVLKGKRPFMVVGTPGGTTIPTSVFQSIVDVIDYGKSPVEAIKAPKFHHQWLPDVLMMESGFAPQVESALKKMNYTLKTVNGIGRTEIICFDSAGKFMSAAADIRGDDSVAGF